MEPTTKTKNRIIIEFYNYRTRKIESFTPSGEEVGLYTCGPTVYNYAHIGNLRTYIFEDVLVKTLKYFEFKVRQVMNLTDVEDKIIRDSLAAKSDIKTFTLPYIEAFFKDLDKLQIAKADFYPKATEHIPEMLDLIGRLIDKRLAYESEGSVYFSIGKFFKYGALSGLTLSELKPGARVDADEYDKENAEDFVLWKAAKPEDEEVGAVWESPWGQGRPGWHIECSAMAMKYLGETFDLHAGAIDLLFPHHEDEIAQSEGATNKIFARFFLEGEHLLVNNHKMAKSAGNFYTMRDIEERGIDPLAFRYLVLSSHYRSKLNFSWESLGSASQTLKKLRELQYRGEKEPLDEKVIKQIDDALAYDLDMPKVLALLHNASDPALWVKYDIILGLGLRNAFVEIPVEAERLLEERNAARAGGNFERADQIRDELKEMGWEIEDTQSGSKLILRIS